jgi:hypothetical protein
MDKYLRWVVDPAERELYVQRVAQKAGLPVETIHRQLGEAGKRQALPAESPAGAPDPLLEESHLLQLLAADPSLAPGALEEGVEALLSDADAREALARLAELAARDPSGDAGSLLAEPLPDAVRNRLSAEIVRADFPAGEARKRYPGVVLSLRIRKQQREIETLQERMKAARSEEEKVSLLALVLAAKKEKERLESERRSR